MTTARMNINFVPRPRRGLLTLRFASLVLIFGSTALLAYPFWGLLAYSFRENFTNRFSSFVQARVFTTPSPRHAADRPLATPPAPQPTPTVAPRSAPTPTSTIAKKSSINTLIIPKIGVNMPIVEGLNATVALRKGAWHIPGTSTPDRGGNTVLGGHRWLYRPPSSKTFYLLDKLKPGDEITVIWEGEELHYRVRETKIVEPYQVEILVNTKEPILTLFTCTPLFTTDKRLVVIAEKI